VSSYESFARLLRKRTHGMISLQEDQIQALHRHYDLMLEWNRCLNLTRVVELEEAVDRHYGEGLYLACRIPSWVETVVDIGSGAGFPGFPVAVARPELRVALVESDQRKAAFLRETRDFTANLEVLAVRAESLTRGFDGVISRAVKPQEVLRVAQRVGKWVALLVSEEDAKRLKWPHAGIEPLPLGRGGALWMADVPRET
jgi:16S rRNA (guanine527-N7)-methyltransferase